MNSYDVIFIHPPRVLKPDNGKKAKAVRSTFLFIPIGLVVLTFFEDLNRENIWTVLMALILFVILIQFILVIEILNLD